MRWIDEFLEPFAHTGDPDADAVVAKIFASGDLAEANALFRKIQHNRDGIPHLGLPFLQEWFRQTAPLPAWADLARARAGQQLFLRHAPAMAAALYNRSLPELYCGWKGVQVLALSSRMAKDPERRINETGQFVFDVGDVGGFEPDGRGVRSCQKVRLVHAGVRHLIRTRPHLWRPEWDEPISQEHLAGTNLAFSSSTLEALQRMGLNFTRDEIGAYMHLWKIAGWYMGIDERLLTDDYEEALALAAQIRRRNYARSVEGVEMTKALLDHLQDLIPGERLDWIAAVTMRWMLGDEMADMLEVPITPLSSVVTGPFRVFNTVIDRVGDRSKLAAQAFSLFNRYFLRAMLARYRTVNHTEFQISPTLRAMHDLG